MNIFTCTIHAEHTRNEFYRTLSIQGNNFIACWAFWEPISSHAEHARKFLKVEYLGRIDYDFQKSRVTGPWDHKVSVSAKKVKKMSCLCTFKITLFNQVFSSKLRLYMTIFNKLFKSKVRPNETLFNKLSSFRPVHSWPSSTSFSSSRRSQTLSYSTSSSSPRWDHTWPSSTSYSSPRWCHL